MTQNQIIVALDVGTTKICAIVGDLDSDGNIRVLGMGQSPSEGLRKGVVVDLDATTRDIRAAVTAASGATGVEINSSVVGVTGEHVSSMNSRAVTSITHANREISEHDVQKVLENARSTPVPSGREVIHVLPRGFSVDGQEGVRRPVGMSGCRLEVDTHVITGSSSFLQNVLKCVEHAGLTVDSMVLEPVASCEAVLTPAEKELGVVMIDIGGGTTDVAVVIDGAIAHTSVIPVGGNHVTNDLTVGLKTSRTEAERLKIECGCALASLVAVNDLLNVPSVEGGATRPMTRQAVADIIEPRMQELYHLVREELRRHGFQDTLTSAVLTGGGSLLHGAPELAQEILELPTRVGRPRNLGALELESPVYATGIGLLYFAAARQARERQEVSPQHFLARAFDQLRGWFSRLFAG
ncbi:MAG TPA: cell division protein FtsA [Armatimonadota bacterium]|nr:cell division protein FtsA [Armatimonadota bacterium]